MKVFYLHTFNGSVDETTLEYIIRDHDKTKYEERKKLVIDLAESLNKKYDSKIFEEVKDQYFNMKEKVEPVKHS